MGLRALKRIVGDGGRVYEPGDAVDEALNWRYPALRAALNVGLLEDPDDLVRSKFGPEARAARARAHPRRASLRPAATQLDREAEPGSTQRPDVGPETHDVDACRQTRKPGGKHAPTPEPETAPPPQEPSTPPAPEPPAGASFSPLPKFLCAPCQKDFKTQAALNSHVGKKHPKAAP